jgi:AcrR family transcriptional regulator
MRQPHQARAERTRQRILAAAAELFAERGFDAVPMREIARRAGCSHTAIYLYFTDKETLLHHISMPPLEEFRERLARISDRESDPEKRVREICMSWIRFCLSNRNLYEVIFNVGADRVDEAEPKLELNRVRNELFGMLKEALRGCLPAEAGEERLLACARITFYMAHGIVGTYRHSPETTDELMARLGPTFRDAFRALLAGFGAIIREGGGAG